MKGEDIFRQLLDSAPDAIVVVDDTGRIALVNLQTERLFDYPRDELIGQAIEILIPERFRAGHIGHRRGYAGAPKVRPMGSGLELFGRKRDGTEFPIEISLSPLRTESGSVVSASIRDITERKRAELAIRRLAAIVDSSQDAIVGETLEGIVTSWNRGATDIFGYTAEEMVGQPITTLMPPGRTGEEAELVARIVRGGAVQHFETVRRRKDGQDIEVSVSLSPLRDGSGQIVGVSKVARDITERNRMEEAARQTRQYLLSAVESIQGAFAIFDPEDRLVLCNSACRSMLANDLPGEVAGMTYAQLMDANLRAGTFALEGESAEELRARLLAYHQSPSGTLDVTTSDQRHLRIFERRTAEGGMVTSIWDVTEDVAREEELRRARVQAEAASAAKSEFLASMSHELRTPLNAILGFAQLLQLDRKAPLTPRQLERIDHVVKGGEHLLRLIDEVLDLARIEAGRVTVSPEPVTVAEVIGEVKTTLDPMAARAGISIVLSPVPDDLPEVVADRTRFKQVLLNYGSNAIKYGRRGGKATFTAAAQGGAVRVTVIDNGIGVPQNKQDRVFMPFHRAGQETGSIEGTGIGLAISKRLAELMGGGVGFKSDEGRGSEFWIQLPAHRAPRPHAASDRRGVDVSASALAGSEGPRYKILYVEDNPSNLAFMSDFMADFERVELITAPSAEIGLDLARTHHPSVVIMDINLPGMSGFEATRRLREDPETAGIPVVGLSAAAMIRDAVRVKEAGFYRYLTKPVRVDELTKVLEELLAREG